MGTATERGAWWERQRTPAAEPALRQAQDTAGPTVAELRALVAKWRNECKSEDEANGGRIGVLSQTRWTDAYELESLLAGKTQEKTDA